MGRYLRRPYDVVLKSKEGHPVTKTSSRSCFAVSEQHMCTAHKGRKDLSNVNSVVCGTGQECFDSDSVVNDTNVQHGTLYSAALTAQVYRKVDESTMIWTALLTTQMYSKGRHTQRCKKGQKDFDVNNAVINNSTNVEQRTRVVRCEQLW